MKNRYFVGVLPNSDMAKVYSIIVGRPSEQALIDKGKKVVVKLPLGDTETHPALNSFTEITKLEAQQLTTDDNI
jgi:hypothetical protein